jgi:hypothetical protein
MRQMIDEFTRVAHEAAKWVWPVVHVQLPRQRRIGGTPRPSSLFWPGREGKTGLEYVAEQGAVNYTYWVGNATVAQYATLDAITTAIDECRKVIAATQYQLRLAKESDAYKRLEQMTDALVLSGAVAPEAIRDLGEFRPLVVPCHMMRCICANELHGSRVRKLVSAVVDGEIDGDTEVTVSRENSELQVVVRVYKSLHVVFHFWGRTWTSCADCWFGIRVNVEMQAIGDSYSDQTWRLSHVCESPEEVIELINRLAEVKWLLGIDTGGLA